MNSCQQSSIYCHYAVSDITHCHMTKTILTVPPPENWKRPPGHPHIT